MLKTCKLYLASIKITVCLNSLLLPLCQSIKIHFIFKYHHAGWCETQIIILSPLFGNLTETLCYWRFMKQLLAIFDSFLHLYTYIDIPRSRPPYWLASNSALSAQLLNMKLPYADPRNLARTLAILYSGSATSWTYMEKETCKSRF